MKRVAVILSGCGVNDGSEIHEAVFTAYFVDKNGAEVCFFAPDKGQRDVIDHSRQAPQVGENRNVLEESARIARGSIEPLSAIDIEKVDAVIFPGGFGAAKNLCSFAVDGADCEIDSQVETIIRTALNSGKVLGAICIAPVLIARALRDIDVKVKLTIGTDENVSGALRKMGAQPVSATVSEVVVDEKNKIVSTPAYMLATRISQVATGVEKLVTEVLKLC